MAHAIDKFANMKTEILHETANLSLRKIKSRLEICLEGHTHAISIGNPKTVEDGKKTMVKLERYPDNLRKMYQHSR